MMQKQFFIISLTLFLGLGMCGEALLDHDTALREEGCRTPQKDRGTQRSACPTPPSSKKKHMPGLNLGLSDFQVSPPTTAERAQRESPRGGTEAASPSTNQVLRRARRGAAELFGVFRAQNDNQVAYQDSASEEGISVTSVRSSLARSVHGHALTPGLYDFSPCDFQVSPPTTPERANKRQRFIAMSTQLMAEGEGGQIDRLMHQPTPTQPQSLQVSGGDSPPVVPLGSIQTVPASEVFDEIDDDGMNGSAGDDAADGDEDVDADDMHDGYAPYGYDPDWDDWPDEEDGEDMAEGADLDETDDEDDKDLVKEEDQPQEVDLTAEDDLPDEVERVSGSKRRL